MQVDQLVKEEVSCHTLPLAVYSATQVLKLSLFPLGDVITVDLTSRNL
jgi:hypothetical protein